MTTTLTRVRIKDTALDQGEEPHPLQGVTGTVLETFPMDEAGADCLLALDCSHQAAARMFRLALGDWEDFQDTFRDTAHDPNRPVIEETLANLEIL